MLSLLVLLLTNEYFMLVVAAVLPAIVLLIRVFKADKLDRESPKMLVSLVLLGILSTLVASALELGEPALFLHIFKNADTKSLFYHFINYFFFVALSEEAAKYLMLRLRTWRSREFNCQFDGVVYAVFVSLGFALFENVLYVLEGGFATAIARALTAVPAHACFGVFMGVFYGAAKRYALANQTELSKRYRTLAVVIPMLMHGAYDFIATLDNLLSAIVFYIFVAVMFFFAFRLVKRAAAEDRYIVQPDPIPSADPSAAYVPYSSQGNMQNPNVQYPPFPPYNPHANYAQNYAPYPVYPNNQSGFGVPNGPDSMSAGQTEPFPTYNSSEVSDQNGFSQ